MQQSDNIDRFIEYNYVTGYIVDVLENISATVNSLKSENSKVKIGITCKPPEDVWSIHSLNDEWDRMVVIYETRSKSFISRLADHLIRINYTDMNESSGCDSYCMYALVKD